MMVQGKDDLSWLPAAALSAEENLLQFSIECFEETISRYTGTRLEFEKLQKFIKSVRVKEQAILLDDPDCAKKSIALVKELLDSTQEIVSDIPASHQGKWKGRMGSVFGGAAAKVRPNQLVVLIDEASEAVENRCRTLFEGKSFKEVCKSYDIGVSDSPKP